MDEPLRVTRSVSIPPGEVRWRFSRSSGPGGQSVNTADSRVELRFDVVASTALGPVQRARVLERLRARLVDDRFLVITASEQRSQRQNREAALDRLAKTLAKALAPPPPKRRATRPTRASNERRIAEKKRRGRTKQLRRRGTDEA